MFKPDMFIHCIFSDKTDQIFLISILKTRVTHFRIHLSGKLDINVHLLTNLLKVFNIL